MRPGRNLPRAKSRGFIEKLEKVLMKEVAFSLALLSLTFPAGAQCRIYSPCVKQIRAIVGSSKPNVSGTDSVDVNYCLYLGDQETDRIDEESGRAHSQQNLMLLHPVPDVAARMNPQPPHRWYAKCLNGSLRSDTTSPLLVETTWKEIPAPVRHILVALGIDDPDLITVSYQILSGSISVYYNPRYQRDRIFYEGKLQILREYMKSHDMQKDLPLNAVIHTDDAAA
jgi:hypothetical protein